MKYVRQAIAFFWIALFATIPAHAGMITFSFDTPVTTGPTQAPDTWYTDRYAPAGFTTSGGQLIQTVSAVDSASNRPPAFSSTFYDTQGRKLDTGPEVVAVSIDLYVNGSWATLNQRVAGLWGTAFDDTSNLTSYPIIEFSSEGGVAHFQGWDDGAWDVYSLPSGFVYDTMHEIGIILNGTNWDYTLDGIVLGSVAALGSTHIENVMLQGYNKWGPNDERTASRDIAWDNLTITSNGVPEPASLAMVLGAMVLILLSRRKQKPQQQGLPAPSI